MSREIFLLLEFTKEFAQNGYYLFLKYLLEFTIMVNWAQIFFYRKFLNYKLNFFSRYRATQVVYLFVSELWQFVLSRYLSTSSNLVNLLTKFSQYFLFVKKKIYKTCKYHLLLVSSLYPNQTSQMFVNIYILKRTRVCFHLLFIILIYIYLCLMLILININIIYIFIILYFNIYYNFYTFYFIDFHFSFISFFY